MKKLLLLMASFSIIFAVSCGPKADSQNNANTEDANNAHNAHNAHGSSGSEIIDLMHAPMMEQPFQKTENVDVDYLVNMTPHHKGAILASKKLLETTTNEDLKTLANAIIADQEAEIEEFNTLIPELQAKNTSYADIDTKSFAERAEKIMNDMMAAMASIVVTGNNDIDFLKGMIPHHQAAIDASKQVLEVTKDDKIKEIANRIIAAQEKEIATMKDLLSKLETK